jgi:F-type H+-transporting ATPase subunit a
MESIQNFFVNIWNKFKAWINANPRRAALWAAAIVLFIIGFFIPVPPPHVELSGMPLFSNGPAWLTNALVTTIIVDLVIIGISVLATTKMNLIPSGLQNFIEVVVEGLFGLTESVAGDRARAFFPWVATIFIFVIVSNWSGLIPGVGSIVIYHNGETSHEANTQHAVRLGNQLAMANGKLVLVDSSADGKIAQTATPTPQEGESTTAEPAHEGAEYVPLFRAPSTDLNMTFALAISTMVMVQIWGVRSQGSAYFAKFVNTKGPNILMRIIAGYVSVLEIISEFARIIAFGFRLFGNIFAGEVVLMTMAFLIPFFLPLPFYGLEVFVGVIQALVFMMLALVFFTMATISHGHEEHPTDLDTEHHHIPREDDVNVVPGTVAPAGSH